MKKGYMLFIAIGILTILAGAFFLMKDSYLFPWEKDWKKVSYGFEGYKDKDSSVSVLDYGYRFVSIEEGPNGKFLAWSWQMTFRNLSKKDFKIDITFELTDSTRAVLASNEGQGQSWFDLPAGKTRTFSDVVESPLYAKQASRATWKYWIY